MKRCTSESLKVNPASSRATTHQCARRRPANTRADPPQALVPEATLWQRNHTISGKPCVDAMHGKTRRILVIVRWLIPHPTQVGASHLSPCLGQSTSASRQSAKSTSMLCDCRIDSQIASMLAIARCACSEIRPFISQMGGVEEG